MAMDIRRPTFPSVPSVWSLMDQLLENPWSLFSTFPTAGIGDTAGYQSVPLNVWETKDGYQVALMAPGVDPGALSVTAVGGTLTVEGERKVEMPEGASVIWREFGPSKFRRTIQLPDAINPDQVEAVYKNGLVFITVPKAEHAKPRSIQVKALAAGT